MSNNLASEQLSMPTSQMGQLEPITNPLDSSIQMGMMLSGSTGSLAQVPVSDIPVRSVRSGYNNMASQQVSVSSMQMGSIHPGSNSFGTPMLSVTNQQTGQMEQSHAYNLLPQQQFFVPQKQSGELGLTSNNVALQQLSALNKRKEPMSNISGLQRSSLSNKRFAQAEHRPWLQQTGTPDRRTVQMMPFSPSSPGSQHLSAPNKKVVRKESVLTKSGSMKQSSLKGQAPMQSSPRGPAESFSSVRSKMRESLAGALALVIEEQNNPSNSEKNSQNEAAGSPGKIQDNNQPADAATDALNSSVESKGKLPCEEDSSASLDGQSASHENFANVNTINNMHTSQSDGQTFHYSLPDDDAFGDNLFARDELLQGNGLSWVLEPVIPVEQNDNAPTAGIEGLGDQKVGKDKRKEKSFDQSPEIVANEIEAELFKLFGGVNKKYKEKGRSLLFNLKDRNNPELRERVMAGEISPERLCNMTAEELASKELSEWRMAKAEEFAQMVVLPDSDVDIRRLVKKTHKGEFQVEVEPVDVAAADVSVGTNSLVRVSSKANEKESRLPSKAGGKKDESKPTVTVKKNNKEGDDSCTITIPSNEGTDLMQGLMVDNELKDAEFLPPIVSLDEFMESLNSEPPFEILPADAAAKSTPMPDKDDSRSGSESKSPVQNAPEPDTTPSKPENVDVTNTKPDIYRKSDNSPAKLERADSASAAYKGELVWEGQLQLNISSTVSFVGIYKSGEKTSGKEWVKLMDIKGRVRLDAFEKFLQELPMSRSRAVMILHFMGKESSTESELGTISEVAESYVSDNRVGFAEPGPGSELYLCPPHKKTIDMLGKILPVGELEALNAIDNGLIGVVVWRKAQVISPNSASHHHHKHSSKKHLSSRRQQDKDTNMNVNRTTTTSSRPVFAKQSVPDADDDDVPPGFGPGANRDDDDLPEFNFTGAGGINRPRVTPAHHSLSQAAARPVDQIRELIYKYGQTQSQGGSGSDKRGVAGMQSWNDDDDDDIPEWQPQAPQPAMAQPPSQPVPGFQRPQSHMVNQQQIGLMQPQQQYPTATIVPGQQSSGLTWAQTQGGTGHWVAQAPAAAPPPPPSLQPQQPTGMQQYYGQPGVSWRQDAPKSRGF